MNAGVTTTSPAPPAAHTCLGAQRHEVWVVLVVELVERTHVLAVADEPVDGGEVLALRQLLVQTPEHLHDAERRRRHRVREVAARGRHPAEKRSTQLVFLNNIFQKITLPFFKIAYSISKMSLIFSKISL